MSTEEKLEFILRAIATAGGPGQPPTDMSDEEFLLILSNWLLRTNVNVGYAISTNGEGSCGCQKP